jgi:CheY-like chemotaxis protein
VGEEAAKWVMIVDDDEDIRAIVVDVLQNAGYLAVALPGGGAALRMMEATVPALVLADLSMIDMDGRTFLTGARELLGGAMPPFVFMTGVEPSRRTDVTVPVLAKPYQVKDLLGVVRDHFGA